MITRPIVLAGCATLMLAACNDEKPAAETTAEGERSAKGEVVGGTISDDMLPLDNLRSHSPPMKETPKEATAPAGDAAPATAPADDAQPEPASDASAEEPEA